MNKIIITVLLSLSFFLKIGACEKCVEFILESIKTSNECLDINLHDISQSESSYNFKSGFHKGTIYGMHEAYRIIDSHHEVKLTMEQWEALKPTQDKK